jgi:hypothetical protein
MGERRVRHFLRHLCRHCASWLSVNNERIIARVKAWRPAPIKYETKSFPA